jgi:prepilin-type N-terminal cleavage/methylation domain-containing protein
MHHILTKRNKGFTLIELLVVISIIGLLSSIVLASLSTARGKAKDAAIKSEVLQMRNLFAQEFSDTGNYAALIAGLENRQTATALKIRTMVLQTSRETMPLNLSKYVR